MVDFVQTPIVDNASVRVAVTIGPVGGLLVLTGNPDTAPIGLPEIEESSPEVNRQIQPIPR